MATQYYNITKTGQKYALDKSTGEAKEVSSIPSGGATITWGGNSLPNNLANALNKPIGTKVIDVQSTSVSTQQPTPAPRVSTSSYAENQARAKRAQDQADREKEAKKIREQLSEGQVDTTTPDFSQFGEFTQQLQFGSRGEDVKRLQQFLNAQGFKVAPDGQAGSAGNETDFFGPATQAALQKFQKTQGIVSSGDPQSTGFGRLGPETLKSVNTFTTPQQAPADTTGGVGAPTDDTGVLPKTANPEIDKAFQDLLNNPNLTDDQKKVAETMFDLISRNDKEQATRFAAAFEAGTEFSDPFFNAQVNMVLAGLRSGLASDAGDLEFEEKQLADLREKTSADLAASKGQLSFEKEQELKNLQKQLGLDLETNAQNLAAVGKTSSSVRAQREQLLRETKEGLVESKERRFGFQVGQQERDVAFKQTQISDELKRLRDKATQDRIADLRGAEERVGTKRLLGLGGIGDLSGLVGGVGGSIERERIRSGLSFAGGFVF